VALAEKSLAGSLAAFGERGEFGEDHIGVDVFDADMHGETTVDASHQPFWVNDLGPSHEPLGDEVGVFDVVRLRLDNTWANGLV
jgi:hypothetical protein